jgi:GNAT superfamily N-acetyltransferase
VSEPEIVPALDASYAWLGLGCETLDGPGGRLVRTRGFGRPLGYVWHITARSPEEIDRLCARVERELASCSNVEYHVDQRTPSPFEAQLVFEGYRRGAFLLMLLEGDIRGPRHEHDIRPVESADDWRAWFALNAIDHPDDTVARSRRAKCPPVRYWLAYLDGEPAGFFSAWGGRDAIGCTENLYVRPELRRRGVATALVHACVADARLQGARALALFAAADDWPKEMYARMGFRPLATKRVYTAPSP